MTQEENYDEPNYVEEGEQGEPDYSEEMARDEYNAEQDANDEGRAIEEGNAEADRLAQEQEAEHQEEKSFEKDIREYYKINVGIRNIDHFIDFILLLKDKYFVGKQKVKEAIEKYLDWDFVAKDELKKEFGLE